MKSPTAQGTTSGVRREHPQMTESNPKVATHSETSSAITLRRRSGCGFKTFMYSPSSIIETTTLRARSTAALSALTAVLPKIRGERLQHLKVSGVVDEGAGSPSAEKPGRGEPVDVVTER